MSYDIYFVKKKGLNEENIYSILEVEEVTSDDEIFISNDLMLQFKSDLIQKGLVFEAFESEQGDTMEFNFPSYQVSLFNGQIVISMPYWDENNEDDVQAEIETITKCLIEIGFTGFDPQTEQFLTETDTIHDSFSESMSVVEAKLTKTKPTKSNIGMVIRIIIFALVAAFLIWKKLKT